MSVLARLLVGRLVRLAVGGVGTRVGRFVGSRVGRFVVGVLVGFFDLGRDVVESLSVSLPSSSVSLPRLRVGRAVWGFRVGRTVGSRVGRLVTGALVGLLVRTAVGRAVFPPRSAVSIVELPGSPVTSDWALIADKASAKTANVSTRISRFVMQELASAHTSQRQN